VPAGHDQAGAGAACGQQLAGADEGVELRLRPGERVTASTQGREGQRGGHWTACATPSAMSAFSRAVSAPASNTAF
jgi:hypothetical protein